MREHGGFEHNRQSLRIVEELEEKYPGFRGLNLTWETREGLAKHQTAYDHPGPRQGFSPKSPSLEAQIANLADELIYCSHDLDDGLEAGLLSEKKLNREVKLFAEAARAVAPGTRPICPTKPAATSSSAASLTARCATWSRPAKPPSWPPASRRPTTSAGNRVRWCGTARARRGLNLELRDYLLQQSLFQSRRSSSRTSRAGDMLGDLFRYYLEHPREIGASSRKRARSAGWLRAICDYLSGMTDRYAILEHQTLFGAKA